MGKRWTVLAVPVLGYCRRRGPPARHFQSGLAVVQAVRLQVQGLRLGPREEFDKEGTRHP